MFFEKAKVVGKLKEALEILHESKLPENLQGVAYKYLLELAGASIQKDSQVHNSSPASIGRAGVTDGLRGYMAAHQVKGAVTEIPCLMYWARENENKDGLNEKEVLEYYRRANIRPPKKIAQSMRDLSSKKYGRLEVVGGKTGYFRLSRVGEDFVLYDVKRKEEK